MKTPIAIICAVLALLMKSEILTLALLTIGGLYLAGRLLYEAGERGLL